jgi:hypothetical protein
VQAGGLGLEALLLEEDKPPATSSSLQQQHPLKTDRIQYQFSQRFTTKLDGLEAARQDINKYLERKYSQHERIENRNEPQAEPVSYF